jgi:hypothetical protein
MSAQLLRSLEQPEEEMAIMPVLTLRGVGTEDGWSIARNDIDFFNLGRDRVAIEIKVANPSGRLCPPSTAVVRAAPFGAFLTWQPVVRLPLPALPPGKVVSLRSGAIPFRPEPLGNPDRVPPRTLLTALGLAGDSPRDPSHQKRTREQQPGSPHLPADLMEMLLQDTPHWVGNINVHVGNKDVERHLARALRVYPRRVNVAWFFVGSGGRDAYAFRLEGLGNGWEAKLIDMTARQSLVLNVAEHPGIVPGRWLPADGTRVILLGLRVPEDCQAGLVAVHVTQQSTGRTAVVEFSLDPQAAGRGCYVV